MTFRAYYASLIAALFTVRAHSHNKEVRVLYAYILAYRRLHSRNVQRIAKIEYPAALRTQRVIVSVAHVIVSVARARFCTFLTMFSEISLSRLR